MDMVAAIQAAKNQLEIEKSKRPSSSLQQHQHQRSSSNQTAEFNSHTNRQQSINNNPYQKSKSFHFGSTTNNTSSISATEGIFNKPPTNIVSFNPKNINGSRSFSEQHRPPSSSSAAINFTSSHPYHTNTTNSAAGGGGHQVDYIHPEYQHNINEDDDNDTITSSLSGTLPDWTSSSHTHDNSLKRLSSSEGVSDNVVMNSNKGDLSSSCWLLYNKYDTGSFFGESQVSSLESVRD